MTDLLIVDDDEKLVALVTEYLTPHGFSVSAVHTGSDGLRAAVEQSPDIVILDVMLPEIDGLEVCRRLRQRSRVPVLMLTARGEDTDRIVGLEIGADDYLAKPFNARELLARIRAILRRSDLNETSTTESALQLGPLSLDAGSRAVTLNGKEVELTSAEFDLLYGLARNAGRVLSREQLLETVHGQDWAAYDRSVDVHISRIRQKIERDPKHPKMLKTIRGVGYQFARTVSE